MMDVPEGLLYAAGGIILAITLLSGPLLGVVDLTQEQGPTITDQFGNGSADVTVESLPERLTIASGRYGSEQYYLRVPDIVANVSNVVGQPLLRYDIGIGELGFSTSTTAFLSPDAEGRTRLTMEAPPFEEGDIQRERYNATITVLVRSDGVDRIIEQETVVVEVAS